MTAPEPRSPEQRRASDALSAIAPVRDNPELGGLYRAYVERVGPAILINGLGQAMASELAATDKNRERSSDPRKRAHATLYRNLERWLCGPHGAYPEAKDLIKAIVEGSEAQYLRAQTEAIAWLTWHKKFCRAQLEKIAEHDAEDKAGARGSE